MPKTNRGKALWKVESKGRDTCPVCLATRIKLLYSRNKSDGTQLQVCKRCKSAPQERIDSALESKNIAFRRANVRELNRLKGS